MRARALSCVCACACVCIAIARHQDSAILFNSSARVGARMCWCVRVHVCVYEKGNGIFFLPDKGSSKKVFRKRELLKSWEFLYSGNFCTQAQNMISYKARKIDFFSQFCSDFLAKKKFKHNSCNFSTLLLNQACIELLRNAKKVETSPTILKNSPRMWQNFQTKTAALGKKLRPS